MSKLDPIIDELMEVQYLLWYCSDSIKELQERKKEFLLKEEELKLSIQEQFKEESLVTDKYELSYRSSTSVNVLDEEIIPQEYKRIKFEVDKKSILWELKDWKVIPWVELSNNKNLQIKPL